MPLWIKSEMRAIGASHGGELSHSALNSSLKLRGSGKVWTHPWDSWKRPPNEERLGCLQHWEHLSNSDRKAKYNSPCVVILL